MNEPAVERYSYSVAEIAKRNGVCEATVWNEMKRGKLKWGRIGRKRRISAEQERDWLGATTGQQKSLDCALAEI